MSRYIDADALLAKLNQEGIPFNADVNYFIMHAPSVNTWISCEEQLPESEEKTYWICTDTEYQCQCRWTNVNHFWTDLTTDWHWNIFDYPQYSKVIAWMPLPEPWKGEEDDKN